MRSIARIVLAGLAMAGIAATFAPPVRIVPRSFVAWRAADGPKAFRAGDVFVHVAAAGRGEAAAPVITVSARGAAPLRVATPGEAYGAASVGIGPLVRGQADGAILRVGLDPRGRLVRIVAVTRGAGGFRAIDFGGDWDGNFTGRDWPTDRTGDGVADLVLPDHRFREAFGGYAGDFPPTS